MIYELDNHRPDIEKAAFVADNASIIGDVTLDEGASIWFGAVLRGDGDEIRIGKDTSIQDNTVVHVEPGRKVLVGDRVTVGHNCIIHGCTIGDDSLIGMGAIIMNDVKIGKNCLVGAGALVTEGKEFPDGSLIIGSPAKVKSEISDELLRSIKESAEVYVEESAKYVASLKRIEEVENR